MNDKMEKKYTKTEKTKIKNGNIKKINKEAFLNIKK